MSDFELKKYRLTNIELIKVEIQIKDNKNN